MFLLVKIFFSKEKLSEVKLMEYQCCTEDCGDDYLEKKLMAMAFWAHKEVLFDKIKQRVEKEEGEKLEKLADIIVEAWKSRTENRKQTEKNYDDFSEKVREVLDE